MTVTFLEARPEHLDAVLEISDLTYEEHVKRPQIDFPGLGNGDLASAYRAHFKTPPEQRTTRLHVCTDADNVAGHVFITVNDVPLDGDRHDRHGFVLDISFRPAYRGAGLGKRLLDHAVAALSDEGVTTLGAVVWAGNDASEALFSSRGFRERSKIYYRRLADSKPGPVPAQRSPMFKRSEFSSWIVFAVGLTALWLLLFQYR